MIAGFDKDLRSLTLRAIDHHNDLKRLSHLTQLCLDELDLDEKMQLERVSLLLECFQAEFEHNAVELDFCLRTIGELILGKQLDE